jgi:hypothetical protein
VIQIQLQQNDPSVALARAGSGLPARQFAPFGEDGVTFADLVDIINPLQHIPVIGTLYRKLTGDQIDPAMRIAGGALFGGPIGAAFSAVAVAIGEVRRSELDAAHAEEAALAESAAENTKQMPITAPVTAADIVRADRAASKTLSELPAQPARPTAATDNRQPRRGGWIVALAYGDETKQSRDERTALQRGIDITV